MGFAVGAETDVISYVSSRLFGLRRLGTLLGVIIGFMLLGNGVGPFLVSLTYDAFGSYDAVLWAAMPLCLICSYCFASLGPYRYRLADRGIQSAPDGGRNDANDPGAVLIASNALDGGAGPGSSLAPTVGADRASSNARATR